MNVISADRVKALFTRHRARIGRVVLLGGALLVVLNLLPLVPRQTELVLDLGASHAQVVALDVTYVLDDDAVRTATLHYPRGAPRTVAQEMRLPVGELELRAQAALRDGQVRDSAHRFTTPADGILRIALFE